MRARVPGPYLSVTIALVTIACGASSGRGDQPKASSPPVAGTGSAATSSGPTPVSAAPILVSAAPTSVGARTSFVSVNVRDFGAIGDGVTDDTAAIQAALDVVPNDPSSYAPGKLVGGAGRARVVFPTGTYKVSRTLDCSQRDYLHLVGMGRAEIVSTSAEYIADFSSSDHAIVQNLVFTSYTARVGLMFNRATSNPFAMFNRLENVVVFVGTNPAANAGRGSIALYNSRAELNVAVNCRFQGDVAVMMTQYPDPAFAPVLGTLDSTIVSLVRGTFDNCTFVRHTQHAYGMILDAPNSINIERSYWLTGSLQGGSVQEMVYARALSHCTLSGVLEHTARFLFMDGTSYSCVFDIQPEQQFLDTSGGGFFNFDSQNPTGLLNSHIDVVITSVAKGARIIKWSGAGPSFQFIGNTLRTGGTSLVSAMDVASVNSSVARNQLYAENVLSIGALSVPGAFHPPTDSGAEQAGALYQGSGPPNDTHGNNGDFYFRTDTPDVPGQRLYVKSSGTWNGIL
jgi:hypothetical protein